MAKSLDIAINHHPTEERKSAIVSELPNHQPYQAPKSHHEQTDNISRSNNSEHVEAQANKYSI